MDELSFFDSALEQLPALCLFIFFAVYTQNSFIKHLVHANGKLQGSLQDINKNQKEIVILLNKILERQRM